MTAMDALDQAVLAWTRLPDCDRQTRVDDAIALLEWGIFSKLQVERITGLPHALVMDLSQKADKTGGALNPETLPALRDLRDAWRRGERREQLAAAIFEQGTKRQMMHTLTGIPMTTLARWVR